MFWLVPVSYLLICFGVGDRLYLDWETAIFFVKMIYTKYQMKKFLIILGVILILAGSVIFYLLQPKTLGISYTAQDLESFKTKIKVAYEPLPADTPLRQTLVVTGSHPVDEAFSSEELTAIADNRHRAYAYFPFQKVQIRINNNGSVEGSAMVNYQDAVNYLLSLGVSSSDIEKGAKKFKVPKINLPIYLKVAGKVENNVSNITVENAKIANIPVPGDLINQYGPGLNDLVESVLKNRQPSYNIEKLEVAGGKVHFKGTSPDVEKAVRGN